MKLSNFLNKYFNLFIFYVLLSLVYSQPLLAKSPSRFIVLSPPKCGTFLIGKALEMVTQKPANYILTDLDGSEQSKETIRSAEEQGSFIVAHGYNEALLKDLVRQGYKVIFLLRDPRDQLISALNWIREGQWPWLKVARLKDYHQQLNELVTGKLYGKTAYNIFLERPFKTIKRLKAKSVYITRFEHLVGKHGGGEEEKQVKELKQLARFLGYTLSLEEAQAIGTNLFSGTLTFRKGQIGQWKEIFSLQHRLAYKQLYGPLLIELGYETDLRW